MNGTRTSNRCFARAVIVASVAGVIGISLGCDKASPSAPTAATPVIVPVAPPAPPGEGITLTASPSVVTSGDQLTIAWTGPSGRGCAGGGDWIALFKVGDPDYTGAANGHSDIWFEHLCGATSGTFRLTAPSSPGAYEFRFMVGDGSVARSNTVTINASASTPAVVTTLIVDGGTSSTREIGQTFWFSGSGYTPGGTLTRYISPPVNGATVLTPTLAADALGKIGWTFSPQCGNPKNAHVLYAVDHATGRITNTVTQTVVGSASCP